MERLAELLVNVAIRPPAGASADRYATQDAISAGISLDGAQRRDVTEYDAVLVMPTGADLETRPAAATIATTWGGVDVVVVTGKVEEVRPQDTVTLAGNMSPVAAVDILIGTPVKGAADVIETTQLNEAPTAMLVGLQVKVLSDCPIAAAPNVARNTPSFMEQSTLLRFLIRFD